MQIGFPALRMGSQEYTPAGYCVFGRARKPSKSHRRSCRTPAVIRAAMVPYHPFGPRMSLSTRTRSNKTVGA